MNYLTDINIYLKKRDFYVREKPYDVFWEAYGNILNGVEFIEDKSWKVIWKYFEWRTQWE